MIAVPLAKKITELFLILFAAVALVKTGILKAENSKILSKLSLYFITPCVIFNSFQKELTAGIGQGLLIAVALAAGFELLFFLVSAVLRRVWKATDVERASIVFANVGNLVIPLVSFALGSEWIIYTSAYIFVFNLLFWTLGVRMFDSRSALDLRKILLNPNILAVLLGAAFLFAGIRLPKPAAIAFDDVAAMIGPLTMIITGMVVGGMKLREMFGNRRVLLVLFFRMIVCSGLAVGLAVLSGVPRGIPDGRSIAMISLLSAIAPSASNINQVAILFHKDEKYASAINVLSTLSCILTMPLWIMLYEALTR